MFKWVSVVLLAASRVVTAAPSDDGNRKIMMMLETEIVAGKQLNGPAAEYQADNNPKTIELVILGRDDGPSRVSDDGEVIFQTKRISEADIDALIEQAFENRLKRERETKGN